MFAQDRNSLRAQGAEIFVFGTYLLEREGRGIVEVLARQIVDRNKLSRVDEGESARLQVVMRGVIAIPF